MVSLVLLATYLAVLASASRAPRCLWLLPGLQLVWVNCHGFFVMGPMVLVAYAAEWLVDRARPPRLPAERPPARTFAAVSVAALLACFGNPYGAGAIALSIEQARKVGGSSLYRTTIGELKSVGDFISTAGVWNPYLLAYFAALLLGVASFVLCARRARFHLFRGLLFTATAALAWAATRNNGLFGVIAAFVTTWNLDDALAAAPAKVAALPAKTKASRRRAAPRKTATTARRWPAPNAVLLAVVLLMALSTVSGRLYAWSGEGRRVGLGERPHWYAHRACAFLARPELPTRMIAYNMSQAAVCMAHGAPAHKQFMDPRLEVNTQETFERYLDGIRRLWHNDPTWQQALGIDYDRPDEIPAILIERGPLGHAAEVLSHDPRWRCVYADDLATVFVATRFADQHHLPAVPLR